MSTIPWFSWFTYMEMHSFPHYTAPGTAKNNLQGSKFKQAMNKKIIPFKTKAIVLQFISVCVYGGGEGISYASVKQTASTAGVLNCSDKNTDPPPQIRAHFYSITLPQPQLVQMCFSSCSCLLCSASEMDEDVYECPITNSLKITFQVTEMCLKTIFCPGYLGAAPLSCVFPFQKMFSDVLPNTL